MIGGMGFSGGRPVFPQTGPAFLAQTGLQLDSLYLFNEAGGDVLDKIGANNLPNNATTPTYEYDFRGRQGIAYDAADRSKGTDILQPGVGSALYGTVFQIPALNAGNIFGLSNGAVTPAMLMYTENVGAATIGRVSDNVAPLLSLVSTFTATAVSDPRWFLGLLQVDRAANNAQLLVADGRGSFDLQTGSIAGFATLTLAGQQFGAGSGGFAGDNNNCYGFARLGADAAGAGLPLQLARRLGWV